MTTSFVGVVFTVFRHEQRDYWRRQVVDFCDAHFSDPALLRDCVSKILKDATVGYSTVTCRSALFLDVKALKIQGQAPGSNTDTVITRC
jgi:hypothetical protein